MSGQWAEDKAERARLRREKYALASPEEKEERNRARREKWRQKRLTERGRP
jgi:hypothetical protein